MAGYCLQKHQHRLPYSGRRTEHLPGHYLYAPTTGDRSYKTFLWLRIPRCNVQSDYRGGYKESHHSLVKHCDNPVVVHDGDDEARLSDSVQWDEEHEGFVADGVQCLLVDGCLLLLHFPNVVHRPHFHVGIHRYGRSLDREQNPSWRRVKHELQEDSEDVKCMHSS